MDRDINNTDSLDYNKKLESYIRESLHLEAGIEFKMQSDFVDFCKKRLTRIEHADTGVYNIYLDFKNKDNIGMLIGCYSTSFVFSIDIPLTISIE